MRESLREFGSAHRAAAVAFTILATVFLWDVLFLDKSLSAFDVILGQSSWKQEFGNIGIHQPILIDSPTAHYPQRQFDWSNFRQGNNADFNPYIFTGMPWEPQGVGAFVTSLPQLWLELDSAIDWSIWFRLICAGFFMYLLLVELGIRRDAAVFGGVVWMFNLHQIVWLEFPQHLATQLWIPLLFLLNLKLVRNGFERSTALALLLVAMLFITSGYTQIVLYTLITLGLFNTIHLSIEAVQTRSLLPIKRWFVIHGVLICAPLVCGAWLLSEADLIAEGLRGAQKWRGSVEQTAFDLSSVGAFLLSLKPRLQEITYILTPDYYGGIWEGRYRFPHGNLVENGRYFGILSVVFALSSVFILRRLPMFRVLISLLLLFGLLMSLYYKNEYMISLMRLIPLAGKGTYGRYITLILFLASIFSAVGVHYLLRYKQIWPLWCAGALLLICVAVFLLSAPDPVVLKFVFPGAMTALLLVLSLLWKKWPSFGRRAGPVLIILITADLFASTYTFNTKLDNDLVFPTNNAVRLLLNDPEPYRVAVFAERPLYHSNVLSYYGIPVVEGYSTVMPNRYASFVKNTFPKVHITPNGVLFLLEPNLEALRLLNVKYLISDQPLKGFESDLRELIRNEAYVVYQLTTHLDRVFCAGTVAYRSGEKEILAKLNELFEEKSPQPVVLERSFKGAASEGECEIENLEVFTHRVTFTSNTDDSRYAFLPYHNNGNWRAKINGEQVSVIQANASFGAVVLPAGQAEVEIFYRNIWSEFAAWSLIAASVVLIVLVLAVRSSPVWWRIFLSTLCTLVIAKSLFSLPLIRNDDIPERKIPSNALTVETLGSSRIKHKRPSPPILEEQPFEYGLEVPGNGLTRIALFASTHGQPYLPYPVDFSIIDDSGVVLVKKRLSGKRIRDNGWFVLDFDTLNTDSQLTLRVESGNDENGRALVLWFDENDRVNIKTFYENLDLTRIRSERG